MKNDTAVQILEFITRNGPVRPSEIAESFSLTPQVIHWHLRKFKAKDLLTTLGKPPHTHYKIKESIQHNIELPPHSRQCIQTRFSYVSPKGEMLTGEEGFLNWLNSKNMIKQANSLACAYQKLCDQIYKKLKQPFSTLSRVQTILETVALEDILISDFYALPQFGKTILGNLVHAAKTSDQLTFTKQIAKIVHGDIKKIIRNNKIDAICFIPHSIPRKTQFLPELRKLLNLSMPEIKVKKLFFGDVPVAQKSLSKISERIENAENTMSIPMQNISNKRILLIDDALGSGATLNCVAIKLLGRGAKKVFGYAIVGSYKGFDVIAQV